MIKSLLIGLDGSRDSDPALDFGLRVAKRHQSLVVGCAVIDEPGARLAEATLLAEGYYGAGGSGVLTEARREASTTLAHFEKRCRDAGVQFQTRLDVGTPHAQISAEAHRFDVVFMGCHTHFELGWRSADDITLHHVIQECARPVVVVPAGAPGDLDGPILVAFDGSMRASRALWDLVATGMAEGRTIHVLSIDRDHSVATRVAERAVDFLSHHSLKATPHAFAGAFPPAVAVLGAVERLQATLLVIGAYGHTPLREFFVGSTTRSVMASTPVPVFCSH